MDALLIISESEVERDLTGESSLSLWNKTRINETST